MFGKCFRCNLKRVLLKNSTAVRELGRVSIVQFNSYGSLNFRRFVQLMQFYKELYNERSVYGLIKNFAQRWPMFTRPIRILSKMMPKKYFGGALLSASLFSFTSQGIADEEMIEAANSLFEVVPETSILRSLAKNSLICNSELTDWEVVTEHEDFHVWRRPLSTEKGLYEYKCAGRYFDVPASGFYLAQVDLEYRKQWDKLVICLDVIDIDSDTSSEVIRWVTHFPFPMCPREYVFVRRSCIDTKTGSIVLTSKTVRHPNCPLDNRKFVRVDDYYSCMIIKPHSGDFTKNGFDYVLTYFDDPKANFPTFAFNWMVTSGVHNFIQKVYDAAKLTADTNKDKMEDASRRIYCLPCPTISPLNTPQLIKSI